MQRLERHVSHYRSPPNPLTSTAPQPFPNNLTMPEPPDLDGFGACFHRGSAERCDTPAARTRPDAPTPAKTGHHFAGTRKRNAAPAWLGGHNVRACPTAHDGGNNSRPVRASVERSRRIAHGCMADLVDHRRS